MRIFKLLTLGFLLNTFNAMFALNTDNAAIVDKNHCELGINSFIDISKYGQDNGSIYSITPGCNFVLDTEVFLGWQVSNSEDDINFQVKRLLFGKSDSAFSVAISLTDTLAVDRNNRFADYVYVNIPITFRLFDDNVEIHFNVGYNLTQFKDMLYSWGVATQIALWPGNIYLIAETYNTRFDYYYYQAGLRWMVQDILQIDVTYDNEFGSHNQDYIALGLTISL